MKKNNLTRWHYFFLFLTHCVNIFGVGQKYIDNVNIFLAFWHDRRSIITTTKLFHVYIFIILDVL